HPAVQGGQGCPQLMGKRGQKLILGAVRLLGVGVQSIFDGDRSHLRELYEDGLIVFRKVAVSLIPRLNNSDVSSVASPERNRKPALCQLRIIRESTKVGVLHG